MWTLPALQGSGGPISLLWQGPSSWEIWAVSNWAHSKSNCCEHWHHFSIGFFHWLCWLLEFQGELPWNRVSGWVATSLPGISWQDGNGYIDRTEIAEVMKAMGEELDDETWWSSNFASSSIRCVGLPTMSNSPTMLNILGSIKSVLDAACQHGTQNSRALRGVWTAA